MAGWPESDLPEKRALAALKDGSMTPAPETGLTCREGGHHDFSNYCARSSPFHKMI
jgi:hypothetical protein